MAKPATFDGYSDRYTVECERVLVTLLRGLGPWKESVFLVGGLTPRYLVAARPPEVPPHAGTLDVDIVIDLQILADTAGYVVPRTQEIAADLVFRLLRRLQRALPDGVNDDLRVISIESFELLVRDDPHLAALDLETQIHVAVVPDLPEQQPLRIQNVGPPAWFRVECAFPLVLGQHPAIDALDDVDDRRRIVAVPGSYAGSAQLPCPGYGRIHRSRSGA